MTNVAGCLSVRLCLLQAGLVAVFKLQELKDGQKIAVKSKSA